MEGEILPPREPEVDAPTERRSDRHAGSRGERTPAPETSTTEKLSISAVNAKLETILEQIQRVKKLHKTTELNVYLAEVDKLRKNLEEPDIEKERGRYEQKPRALKNIQDVYNEIIKAANSIIDTGKDVDNAKKLRDNAMKGKKHYKDSLDAKELAVLEVIISGSKGFAGDEHLLQMKQKELDRKQSIKEEYVSKKNTIDGFLEKIGDVDVSSWNEMNKKIEPLENINRKVEEINKLKSKIEEKKRIIENLEKVKRTKKGKEFKEDRSRIGNAIKSEKEQINEFQKQINDKMTEIQTYSNMLSQDGNSEAENLITIDGEGVQTLNDDVLKSLNNNEEYKQAFNRRELAARSIANKLAKDANIQRTISAKDAREFLPSLDSKDDYDAILSKIKNIIEDINKVSAESGNLRREIDAYDREIMAIQSAVNMLQSRLPKSAENSTGGKVQANSNNGYFRSKVKTAKEYEAEGVELDQRYLSSNFRDKFKQRYEYVLATYPKNNRFKRLKSALRAVFNGRDVAFAVCEKRAEKEINETTMASAFRDTMKVLEKNPGITIEQAQTEALRQMQKKEMGKNRVNDYEVPER